MTHPTATIRALMAEQGVTTRELARRLGITQPSVMHLLTCENPTLASLERAAGALGCRVVVEFRKVPNDPEEENAMRKLPTTIEDVDLRVHEITTVANDNEHAHGLEDALHQDVLRSIARHSTDPRAKALAKRALLTLRMEFQRWCA